MTMFARMNAWELCGHVAAIPDASELSQALAAKLSAVMQENEFLQARMTSLQEERFVRDRKIAELNEQLDGAMDKIAGFMDLTDPNQQKLAI